MMDYELNAWAAENLLGVERGRCSNSTYGYGESEAFASGLRVWFYCRWCKRRVGDGGEADDPCPQYPFPQVTLAEVMQALDELGHAVTVGYGFGGMGWVATLDDMAAEGFNDPLEALTAVAREVLGE